MKEQVMETLTILGSALGLAALSGINLYATVAITGLAIQLGWVELPAELLGLDALASWWIVGVAGGMYLVEFVADKWPWLDNIWDMVHTFVRPPAAALVALAATASMSDPVIQVIAVLLAGGVALGSHAVKSTTRLTMNATTPNEPASNVAVSLMEDAFVAGAVLFVMTHPILSLAILCVLVVLTIWLAPKLIRLFAVQVRSAIHTLRYLWNGRMPVRWGWPPSGYLGKVDPTTILLTLPCASLRLKRVGRYRSGYLVFTDRKEIVFLTRKWLRPVERRFTNVEIDSIDVRLGRLFRTLTLHTTAGKASFKLYRNEPAWLERRIDEMRSTLGVDARVRRPKPGWAAAAWAWMRRAFESMWEPAAQTP
jgi:hypothetical protein